MAAAGIGGRVEGVQAVRAALAVRRVRVLYVEGSRRDAERWLEEARLAGATAKQVETVADLSRTDSHQGLVAKARPIPFASLESLLAGDSRAAHPALVVLDHLTDPRNVGAIARSALAAGMTGMVIPRRRSAPLSALAFRASAGALEHLPVASVSSVAAAAHRASGAGVWTVGLDASGAEPLFGLGLLAEPVALFVGAEGRGLGQLVRQRLDLLASIPMAANTSSLNAGVAAALACFEVRRVRRGDR
ncbi:MAG: 23S rRNA (guanosine(2251)-2'-O)-methyltransferase RlmB [bacterium]|nr:23S rRNA (guanosine(2251)-2'-O)-methyltransferase RlmB [bacterium]MDE0287526.1 23S rRNA (guanosine(2251)-2'-O)-methyltransferase RlmB [bacterium]MDE0437747.1 23S rRNA (guanosine(2251)-2'-O)-methyltransferase RlmB [bacterium]